MKKQPKPEKPLLSIVALVLILIAIGVMVYIYLRNKDEDPAWANYALMMIAFAVIGTGGSYFVSQLHTPSRGVRMTFAPFDINTGIRALVMLAACMITQVITQTALSVSTVDRALYYVFAAVCEEVFFRVFLLTVFSRMSLDPKQKSMWGFIVIGVIVQAAIFTLMHGNYYDNIAMLAAVFIGGLILGIGYIIWGDATANILAHFFLNLIAVQSLLITL